MEQYIIQYKNQENELVITSITDNDSPSVPTVEINLTPSDDATPPSVLQSLNSDDDKTEPIKSKQLKIGFLSGTYDKGGVNTVIKAKTFADGSSDARFSVEFTKQIISVDVAQPFDGNISISDVSEPYQPRPNQVVLTSTDGLNSLKTVELTEADGSLPSDHYKIIDYIYFCLLKLSPSISGIYVVMNLYEQDTDPLTSHAFNDTYLDALTFEKEVDTREDCFTVLTKILDAFGCFICREEGIWWIIRWDEFDSVDAAVITNRVATFNGNIFLSYIDYDIRRVIASDYDVLYDGLFLSMDSARIRYQRKANKVIHTYKYQLPEELPCNAKFTRGTPDDIVLPLLTFDPECWTLRKGTYVSSGSPSNQMKIGVRYDANGNEEERFLFLTPVASAATDAFTYAESKPMDVKQNSKFEFSYNWRTEGTTPGAFGGLTRFGIIWLHGDDNSDWLLGNEDINDPTTPLKWWDTSNFTVNTSAGRRDLDTTLINEDEWQRVDLDRSPPIPVDGKLYIWFFQFNQSAAASEDDALAIDYTDLEFKYLPYVGGVYESVDGHKQTVSADNDSRLVIEKEMFIGDSPEPMFKGALKKSGSGSNFILTENWNDFFSPVGSMPDVKMSKFTLFAWWNQFRKTRTVIESDVQGLKHYQGSDPEFINTVPSHINSFKINHDEETSKKFMLTSFRNMNFRNCGWQGVFVETSDQDMDRDYNDDYELKFIYKKK